MKINVEFDLTPEEFRQSLGLPDVEIFQKDLMSRIQEQMESGVEGYDPMSLMQPFLQPQAMPQQLTQGLSQGLSSFGSYQQMMLDMLRQAGAGQKDGEKKTNVDSEKANPQQGANGKEREASKEASDKSAKTSASGGGAGAKSSASARSRTKRED